MRYLEILAEDAPIEQVGDDLFEMANLRQGQTGVPGTIYISTAQASHAPRVKHYAGRPGASAPFFAVSIDTNPKVVEVKGVTDRELNAVSTQVIEWVRLNHDGLRRFWFEGNTWFDDEVNAFKRSLVKLSPRRKPTQPLSAAPTKPNRE